MRRIGLGLAVVASALWLTVAGLLVVPPGGSVPLDVVLLYTLAVPLSLAAAVVLLLALRRRRTAARSTAAALAVASAVLLPAIPVVGSTGSLPDDVLRTLFFLGVAAFVLATVLFALPARRTE